MSERLFKHGFEGGDFGVDPETGHSWTDISGAPIVTSEWAHRGNYSCKITASEDRAYKDLGVPYEDLFFAGVVYISELSGSAGQYIRVIGLSSDLDYGEIFAEIYHDGTNFVWALMNIYGANRMVSKKLVEIGKPIYVEIRGKGTDLSLYIDGERVARDASMYPNMFTYAYVGKDMTAQCVYFVDSLIANDEGPIGPEPVLAVTVSPSSVSLKVGETETFTVAVTAGEPPYSIRWIDKATGVEIGIGETYTFQAAEVVIFEIYAEVTDNIGVVATSNMVTITVSAKHFLTVDSTPIQGVPFTMERVS